MFLAKSQVVLLVALVGLVHCGKKWPRPPPHWSSEESNSRSLSSEEYFGASQPPLQLGGNNLPTPVYSTSANGPSVISAAYSPKPNTLYTTHFSELVKANTVLINESVGPNRQLSYISKAHQIPMPDGVGEMYYVKGYFTNEYGYRNKCKFYLYNKDAHSQVLEPRCH